MKTLFFILLSVTAFSQSYIDSFALQLKNLEARVASLEAGSGGPQLTAQRLTLNTGGTGPAELKMVGLGARSFSLRNEQGNANLYLYGNPAANEVKSLFINNAQGQNSLELKQNGSMRFYGFPLVTRPSISQTKYYYIMVLDELGNTIPIRVRGRWLYNILNLSE